MSHLNPSGSATGNPRNKTALGPGKSLMDWVRLTNSGKDLTGTGGVLLNVTLEQLARHNKETDAWIAIGGIVYNVTEYLSFHPGGEAELMRGVGTDATKLFNTVHSWVNYQSLLKNCIVGRLKTTILTTASSNISKNAAKENISNLNSNLIVPTISKVPSVSAEKCQHVSKIDWFQQLASVFLVVYFKQNSIDCYKPLQISVSLNAARSLTTCVENEIGVHELEEDVRWPCSIKVDQSRAEIRLTKIIPKLWSVYGKKLSVSSNVENFCSMNVVHVSNVTHDTKLIGLKYANQLIHFIHVGHHVQLKNVASERRLIKSYTPVSFLISKSNPKVDASVFFLIKEYKMGQLSPILCSLQIGDELEMSKPSGGFNIKILEKRLNLILFAAGTGFTPFTSLIVWTLKTNKSSVKLIFFNKTENDIIWKDDLDDLVSQNPRFQVTHVLSQPLSSWSGLKGFVTEDLAKSVLVYPVEETFVCICGPIKFNELCVKIVEQCGYSKSNYFCFQG